MDITFKNKRGDILTGTIDQAENPIAQAVFSHCFTCSKDHAASYRICKALADQNIQVLRFDFTGLGKSEGDFAESHFSGNVSDLIAINDYIKDNWNTNILNGGSWNETLHDGVFVGTTSQVGEVEGNEAEDQVLFECYCPHRNRHLVPSYNHKRMGSR